MSLMKLLSVSESFMSDRGEDGRYHVIKRGRLPRYILTVRETSEVYIPSGLSRTPEWYYATRTEGLERVAEPLAAPAPPMLADTQVHASIAKPVPAVAEEPRVLARALAGGWSRLRRWFGLGNPFASGLGARGGRPLVQASLSLDEVRVVRNDFAEEDAAASPTSAPKLSKNPWSRVAGVGRLTSAVSHWVGRGAASERVR
jgi:hypothetical protein